MTAEYVIHCSVVYLAIYKNRFILRQPFYELSELYKMGLVNSVTKKWLDNGMQETSEEMTDYIMSFILKIWYKVKSASQSDLLIFVCRLLRKCTFAEPENYKSSLEQP